MLSIIEVCFKGSIKNLYNIFAAEGSLPKEARRCWYVAKPICDSLPTTTFSAAYVSKGIDAWVLLRNTKTDLNSAAGPAAAKSRVEHQNRRK